MAQAPVSLEHVPRPIATKALHVIEKLAQGADYRQFHGKRLVAMGQRTIVSIPLGWGHRLICREEGARLGPIEVLSHETYNTRLASGGWRS